MSKKIETLKTFVSLNKDNFSIQLKRKYPRIFNEINKLDGKNFSEKIYKIMYPASGNCTVCGKVCNFVSVHKGYLSTCSLKCRDIIRNKECRENRKCVICHKKFEVYKIRKKSCCSDECLSKLLTSDEVSEKRIKSLMEYNLKTYGVSSFLKTDNFKKKANETKLKRYGNINYRNIEKSKQTRRQKYGDENYNNIEKMKSTCLKKYGVNNFSKTVKFKKIHYARVISRICEDNNMEPLFSFENYDGVKDTKYDFKCKKCSTRYTLSIDCGGIPHCTLCEPGKFSMQSKLNSEIQKFYTDEYFVNVRNILDGKELDFYFPKNNIAIEFNGIYWHSEITGNKNKTYHLNKTHMCNSKGIRLIHIFENEWILRRDIVISKIKHILKKNSEEKIYARTCNISPISTKIKNEFLNNTHIQGEDRSKVKLGAYYQNELVAVMTFGTMRRALGQNSTNQHEYELLRFSTSKTVVGIASKLLSYFIKTYNPSKIITYADRRYSDESSFYTKLGFVNVGVSAPNYWYFHISNKLHLFHRYNFAKHTLSKKLENFNPKLSEWENMQLNGYDRIWDCGNLKYEWTKSID